MDFHNTEIAFQAKSDADLQRAHWLFSTLAKPWLVSSGSWAAKTALKLGLPIKGIVKKTVFQQFCGGETIVECKRAIDKLNQFGVQSILDYSVEGKESDADFDATCEKIIETIRFGKDNPGIPLAVFKPTGLGRFALLEKVSANKPLSSSEEKEWTRVRNRFVKIAEAAKAMEQPVMVDAEETWIQHAVDALAEELMATINQGACWLYTTVQMYRHDRLAYLKDLTEKAKSGGFLVGVKVVRGAYMEK